MIFNSILYPILEKHASPSLFCHFINIRNSVRGIKYRANPIHEELGEIYKLTDHMGDSVYVCRRKRFRLYRYGVMERITRLAADYHLSSIEIKPSGVLIDCGANIGELGIWARKNCLEYIPFEPEPLEAKCSDLNNDGTHTRCHPLWNENTILPFYSAPEAADSSLIFMGGTPQRATVEAITLDSATNISYLSRISGTVILKIDAEGGEPEVLQGARDTLAYVDYVVVDCGHERGVEKAHTFVEVFSLLNDHAFRLQGLQLPRVTALFARAVPIRK